MLGQSWPPARISPPEKTADTAGPLGGPCGKSSQTQVGGQLLLRGEAERWSPPSPAGVETEFMQGEQKTISTAGSKPTAAT